MTRWKSSPRTLTDPTAVEVTWKGPDGLAQRILYRDDEPRLDEVAPARSFAFDGDGRLFRLASEALRIRLAHLFDPYVAVNASQIEPLPHQLTAVYGAMLDRQPLRFLLADDPGAGKTVMAGLLIKELLIRGSLERCLIVAPGSLVEQWQDELNDKFDLAFDIVSREQIETSVTGNPFAERPRLIARLDMLARNDDLKAKLEAAPPWDLIVCDEAHRMSASFFGQEVRYTKRHQLGVLAGRLTRHFLLMTATPHNGKEEDFQLFMGLLDADRFEEALPGRRPQGRPLGHDAAPDQGGALPVRRQPAVPRTPRLHRLLRPVTGRIRALRGCDPLCARRNESCGPFGRRRHQAA